MNADQKRRKRRRDTGFQPVRDAHGPEDRVTSMHSSSAFISVHPRLSAVPKLLKTNG
jgi:hypothetical protein